CPRTPTRSPPTCCPSSTRSSARNRPADLGDQADAARAGNAPGTSPGAGPSPWRRASPVSTIPPGQQTVEGLDRRTVDVQRVDLQLRQVVTDAEREATDREDDLHQAVEVHRRDPACAA